MPEGFSADRPLLPIERDLQVFRAQAAADHREPYGSIEQIIHGSTGALGFLTDADGNIIRPREPKPANKSKTPQWYFH